MDVRHDDDELLRLEADPEWYGGLDRGLVRAFRKVLILLRAIKDETKIYNYKGLRFEKLKGARDHQHSVRLNQQFRLVLEIEKGVPGNTLVIKSIEDYH